MLLISKQINCQITTAQVITHSAEFKKNHGKNAGTQRRLVGCEAGIALSLLDSHSSHVCDFVICN